MGPSKALAGQLARTAGGGARLVLPGIALASSLTLLAVVLQPYLAVVIPLPAMVIPLVLGHEDVIAAIMLDPPDEAAKST